MARSKAEHELVWVYPLEGYFVQGEPHVAHEVTPERAEELVGMPLPAFTLTRPKKEPATTGEEEV